MHIAEIVGGEEQGHPGQVDRLDEIGQALAREMALDRLRADPQRLLPLGHHPARHDRVDPDAMLAEIAREGARHAVHAGLGGGVDGHAADRLEPRIGAEVDDRALARRDHVGGDRLGREKHVAKVGRDALVVIGGRHLSPAVPIVARRVVDENAGRTQRAFQPREGVAQRRHVAQVARLESHARRARQLLGERASALRVDVDEADVRTLVGFVDIDAKGGRALAKG